MSGGVGGVVVREVLLILRERKALREALRTGELVVFIDQQAQGAMTGRSAKLQLASHKRVCGEAAD